AYLPHNYIVPGDYPSAAAMICACAVTTDPTSELSIARLRPHEEEGTALFSALQAMGVAIQWQGETLHIQGGRTLRAIEMDGDCAIDSIPTLVAAACFAEGKSVFYNIETLHYKESDRIDDLCTELRKAGCDVIAQRDAIIVQVQPQGVVGGVVVDGHADHRLLMALTIVGLRSRQGITLRDIEHIAKSYPAFFDELQHLGVSMQAS
ncbi:MAG: 3-phosphoshikimate 1-carboxyvinyltransferase, partial [Chloroflexota bacterium]|nr:3-phosphoshikimate 1-carboxyvinyltransferase [Chloroflexota bacterium]